MGTFNYYHYNKKFYIFEDDEDAENFYYSQDFKKSKIFKKEQIFEDIGLAELVFSGGYYCGGSLDYISILDYFNYNDTKDKKEHFHEFLEDMLKEKDFKNIYKYTKKDIIYMFLDLVFDYEDINLNNIVLKNYDLKKIKWKRTKKDLKDFIIKAFDEMIKQDIEKAKKKLEYIAENYGALYVERTGTYTYEKIK